LQGSNVTYLKGSNVSDITELKSTVSQTVRDKTFLQIKQGLCSSLTQQTKHSKVASPEHCGDSLLVFGRRTASNTD